MPGGAEPLPRKRKKPPNALMFLQSRVFLEASRIPHRRYFFCRGEHTPCLDEAPSLGRAGERKPPNALMCLQSRSFSYLLKPQLSYVCPTPGQLPEDAQRLGLAEIDTTAREQGMGQAGAGPGRGRGWSFGWLVILLLGWLVVWLFGCLFVWLFGCLVGSLVVWLFVWLFGCLVVCLVV